MKRSLALLAGLLAGTPALAQDDVKFTPSIDARLRYDKTDQDGVALDANALTLRVRPGVTVARGEWSALVEGEATIALSAGYNDGLNGKTRYPVVADPRNVELNRAQLRWASGTHSVTLGRQRIALADERFVGPAAWRQNEQTFDAARVQWGFGKAITADVTYSWNLRTVNGERGFGARPTAIHGDNVFALLSYKTGPGTLTGFAYLVDQDSAAVQGYRLSSQTYGLRFAGNTDIAPKLKLSYTASWARQSGWHRNPNDYAATYWLGEAGLASGRLTATAGYEVLGASSGAALTSVQTPLASFFKWNGWASKFNPTPANGLRDAYGTIGYGWKKVAGLDAITLAATVHRFDSDRLDQHYGNEFDLAAIAKRGHYTAAVRYASYDAHAFATNTRKLWLTLEWSL
ncbi:alginate export family protein [Sphingomonas sp.]|uniref:alginate export family protein n=1 Tax=Sphingomonas sp. TaxID=28214 RepID=UPI001B1D0CC4|nr:alginate export family protein [Sphingomonas sp.]MBO9713955.1 alginate export family protein [Sphingomonas sp.]